MVPRGTVGWWRGRGSPGGRRSRPALGMSRFGQVRAHPRVARSGPGARASAHRPHLPAGSAPSFAHLPASCPGKQPPPGDLGVPAPWSARPAFSVPQARADVGAETGRPFGTVFWQTEPGPGPGRRPRPCSLSGRSVFRGAGRGLVFSRVVRAPDGVDGRDAGGGPGGLVRNQTREHVWGPRGPGAQTPHPGFPRPFAPSAWVGALLGPGVWRGLESGSQGEHAEGTGTLNGVFIPRKGNNRTKGAARQPGGVERHPGKVPGQRR